MIRRLVHDLNFPVQIVVCPIVREPDGLARVPANIYLNPEDKIGAGAFAVHERDQARFESENATLYVWLPWGRQAINEESSVRLDYLEIVDPDTLEPVAEKSRGQPWPPLPHSSAVRALSITFCCTPRRKYCRAYLRRAGPDTNGFPATT